MLYTPQFSGSEWDEFTRSAMSQKYGTAWQAVSARTQGDWGIEGFVRPDGILLQSYATDGRTTPERTAYQKAKLTTDIQKLKKNSDSIKEAIGELAIRQYIFLVPSCDDKSLITHAESKARLVREWCLSWISADFYISVQEFDFVRLEYQALHSRPSPSVQLSPLEIPTDFALSSVVANSTLLLNLERKLAASPALGGNVAKRNEWERRLIRHHASAEHLKWQLGATAPELSDRLQALLIWFEGTLVRRAFAPEPVEDMRVLGESLRQAIREEISSLSQRDADEIAFGALADWLLRCPLEYERTAA